MAHGAISSALLARIADRLNGPTALLGAFDVSSVGAVSDLPHPVRWFADELALADGVRIAGGDVTFGVLPDAMAATDVVLAVPKGTRAQTFVFARAAHAVLDGGRVWLVGAVDEGVRSAAKRMAVLGAVRKVDAARHGAVFVVDEVRHAPCEIDAWVTRSELDAPGGPLQVAALPGVFAGGALDDGTRMLLDTFGDAIPGNILDVGCGAGIVGAWLARSGAARVCMVDAAAVAVDASRRTVDAAALHGVEVRASDVYSAVEGCFDMIVSNPPFHQGAHTDHDVASRLIEQAPRYLERGGTLRIVANRFLRIPHRLDAVFGSHRVLAEDGRFRVYESRVAP